jgi:hypothetical protein
LSESLQCTAHTVKGARCQKREPSIASTGLCGTHSNSPLPKLPPLPQHVNSEQVPFFTGAGWEDWSNQIDLWIRMVPHTQTLSIPTAIQQHLQGSALLEWNTRIKPLYDKFTEQTQLYLVALQDLDQKRTFMDPATDRPAFMEALQALFAAKPDGKHFWNSTIKPVLATAFAQQQTLRQLEFLDRLERMTRQHGETIHAFLLRFDNLRLRLQESGINQPEPDTPALKATEALQLWRKLQLADSTRYTLASQMEGGVGMASPQNLKTSLTRLFPDQRVPVHLDVSKPPSPPPKTTGTQWRGGGARATNGGRGFPPTQGLAFTPPPSLCFNAARGQPCAYNPCRFGCQVVQGVPSSVSSSPTNPSKVPSLSQSSPSGNGRAPLPRGGRLIPRTPHMHATYPAER